MTEQPYVDPGHRVPDDQWGEIVRRANEIRTEHEANKTGGAAPIAAPVVDMTATGRASGKFFGVSGIPTQLGVLHSGECPLRGGYARSLTLWAATPLSQGGPQASWHHFIDPISWVKFIPPELGAWHASEANQMSEGFEQAGYARFSRAEWLTPDGLLQLNTLAFAMADFATRNGIPPVWLTTDQVTAITTYGDRTTKGFCLHRQIDPETRTDPGDNYPYDLLLDRIRDFMGLTIAPAGAPDSTPKEWDDVASEEQIEKIVRRVVWGGANGTMIHNYRLGRGEYPETTLGALEGRIQNEILPAVVVGPLQQQLGGLAAKVDALATALAAKPDNPLTKEEALAQLDASVKASFGEYTPVLVRTDTVPEGVASNG